MKKNISRDALPRINKKAFYSAHTLCSRPSLKSPLFFLYAPGAEYLKVAAQNWKNAFV